MDITATEIVAFRDRNPAFSVVVSWPDSVVEAALNEGDAETGGSGWGGYEDTLQNLKRRGMHFYASHWLATTYPSGATDITAQSGTANNSLISKSVGDEPASFGAASITKISDSGDGLLASTSWGQQFMRLRKRVGMGARAV